MNWSLISSHFLLFPFIQAAFTIYHVSTSPIKEIGMFIIFISLVSQPFDQVTNWKCSSHMPGSSAYLLASASPENCQAMGLGIFLCFMYVFQLILYSLL